MDVGNEMGTVIKIWTEFYWVMTQNNKLLSKVSESKGKVNVIETGTIKISSIDYSALSQSYMMPEIINKAGFGGGDIQTHSHGEDGPQKETHEGRMGRSGCVTGPRLFMGRFTGYGKAVWAKAISRRKALGQKLSQHFLEQSGSRS